MADKRYYWLKLKEDYFDNPKIKKLRKIAGGDTYTIIYLEMQLLSIKNGGIVQYEGIEQTFEEELALKLDEDIDDVKVLLAYLQSQGLIDLNENNEYMLLETTKMIGSESESAERVRKFRERKEQKMLQCNADVTNVYISNSISNSNSIDTNNNIKEIIDYLNEKAGTHYRPNTNSTQRHIKARLNEKYTLDDFKTVIDKKVQEWKGTEFEQYLRPETLFGNKFESYLNAEIIRKPRTKHDIERHKRTKAEIEAVFTDLDDDFCKQLRGEL